MLFALAVVANVLWLDGAVGWAVLGIAAVLEIGETAFWVYWNRRRQVQVGAETLVGAAAVVVTSCRPAGQVRVQGEIWQAHCEAGADPGTDVVVEAIDGLRLAVRPVEAAPAESDAAGRQR